MIRWEPGRDQIIAMLEARDLSRVVPDDVLAERMIETAQQHLESAHQLAASDPYLAYAALHDAVRKSMAALLQGQGLRATTSGGHIAVQEAIKAQFSAAMGAILRPVNRIRATRHEGEYPGPATWIDEDLVMDDLPAAQAVVEAAAKTLPHLSPFV